MHDDRLQSLVEKLRVDLKRDFRQPKEALSDQEFDYFQLMLIATDYSQSISEQWDRQEVADRQWRGIDDDRLILDLWPHEVEGKTCDDVHDENCYFQRPYPKLQIH